jgi:uridylate kinase
MTSSLTRPTVEPKLKAKPLYKRILFKISGEALMGDLPFGQCPETLNTICNDVKEAVDMGVEVCLVVGGGNIFRGISGEAMGMERASADYMGMLATVLNALALQNMLEKKGCETRVQSAIHMMEICEPYIRRRAVRHMEHGRVVIFAAGTGNPFFTTDTAAALRAVEMGCQAMLKGTQVDGVYDSDPKKNPDAKRYDTLTYHDVLSQDLRVMDATAIALARENKIPIMVFSIQEQGNLARALCGQGRYTLIQE